MLLQNIYLYMGLDGIKGEIYGGSEFFVLIGLSAAVYAQAASITVSKDEPEQQVVGFGAGAVYYQGWVTALGNFTREAFYDTAFTGLNLSLLRMGNWTQDLSEGVSPDDVAIVKAAKDRQGDKLKIEMSSWSAPANLKPSNSLEGRAAGGDKSKATLKPSNTDPYGKYVYSDFASWWKQSYLAYRAAGIPIDYISLQNEPDMFADYHETLFDPTESGTVAGYAQALNAVYDSLKSIENPPKILGPEPLGIGYSNFQKYMNALDASKLDGYAYHLYHAGNGHDNSLENYNNPENFRSPMEGIMTKYLSASKPIIMTEFCSMEENGKEEYMTGLAHIIQIGFTSGGINGYIAWELFWGEGKGQLIGVCTKGWGSCSEDQIVISPEYHALRHYSKFVNPGWYVVPAIVSDAADLYAVAFRDAYGRDSVTVVVVNEGSSAVSLDAPVIQYDQVLVMGHAEEKWELVTAVQSVENGEKSKVIDIADSYSIPGNSITTFVYKNMNSSAIRLASDTRDLGVSIAGRVVTVGDMKALQVFDMQGRPVYQAQKVAGSVSLADLPAGPYVLRAHDGSSWKVQRIQLR